MYRYVKGYKRNKRSCLCVRRSHEEIKGIKKRTERFLCKMLTIAILVSLCYTAVVSAAADECKIVDINSSLPENVVKMSFRASKLSDNGNLTKTSGDELFYSDIPDIDCYLARRIEVFMLDDSDNDRNFIAVLPEEHSTVYRLPQRDYVASDVPQSIFLDPEYDNDFHDA